MKNIREEKGYTYGIYASMVPLRFASYLVIGSDVQKANRTDAINEVNREIRLLQDELLREEELQMVRNHMLGSFQSDLSSPFALSEKFKGVHLFGLDYSYYDRYIETIETITPIHIREIARKYLDPDSMTEISVG
jgi:predicted Zn-dependent peptidase